MAKSATATNVAAVIALSGHSTLLVDIDQQADATTGLGFDPYQLDVTINDLFADPNRDPMTAILETAIENLHILPAHPSLSKTETGMGIQRADPGAPDPMTSLRAILGPLGDRYDFIIIDTPPSLNYMTRNALAAADELLIIASAGAHTENGVKATIEAYEQTKRDYNPSLMLRGILVTRMKRTNASTAVLDALMKDYPDLVLRQVIMESTAVDEATQLQEPVVTYDPNNGASLGYIKVAKMIMGGRTNA